MSDEPTPPPLRLKPRIRSTPDTPPSAPAAPPPESATGDPAPAAAAEAPKLRLKPKLAADPVTPAESAPAEPPPTLAPATGSTSAPAAPPPPEVALPAASDGGDATGAEAPKFKLKMKPAAVSSSAAPVPLPPAAAVAAGEATAASPAGVEAPAPGSAAAPAAEAKAAPAPFSVITNAPRGTKKYPPPVPHLRAPGKVEEPTPPPPPVRKRKAPASGRLVLALVGLVLVAGGYWGYLRLMAPAPPPPPTLKPKPTTMPGRAIEKAKEAVAAQRAAEQAPLNEVVDGEESADGKPLEAAKPKAPPPAVVTTQIAPGVTASSASIDVTGNAGLGFRTWVGNVRINGVFQGKTPRALVNGRAYHVGQVVDEPLGIVIAAIDTQAKTILFRDRTGATALRRY